MPTLCALAAAAPLAALKTVAGSLVLGAPLIATPTSARDAATEDTFASLLLDVFRPVLRLLPNAKIGLVCVAEPAMSVCTFKPRCVTVRAT